MNKLQQIVQLYQNMGGRFFTFRAWYEFRRRSGLLKSLFPVKPEQKTTYLSMEHLSIGFVGKPRFKSVVNFATVFCRNFPTYQFHFFGGPVGKEFEPLRNYPNCRFHGFFITPDDLTDIYSQFDLVLSTYDVEFEIVRYAEPNKLYEAIYFETPIIVSKGTFLAEKTEELGVGYAIDPMSEEQVISFEKNVSIESITSKIEKEREIPTSYCINSNKELFDRIGRIANIAQ